MRKLIFAAAAVAAALGVAVPAAPAGAAVHAAQKSSIVFPVGDITIYVSGVPEITAQCASGTILNPPGPVTEVADGCGSYSVELDTPAAFPYCVEPGMESAIPAADQNPTEIQVEPGIIACPG